MATIAASIDPNQRDADRMERKHYRPSGDTVEGRRTEVKSKLCTQCGAPVKFAGLIFVPPKKVQYCVDCDQQEWRSGTPVLTKTPHPRTATARTAGTERTRTLIASEPWPTPAKSFSSSENVFDEGEPVDYLYKIETGYVQTFKVLIGGRRLIDAFYIPGDVFGVEFRSHHSLSAEAVTRSKIHFIDQKRRGAPGESGLQVTKQLLTATIAELQRSQNHSMLLLKGAKERVVGFLLDMAERQNSQRVVDLPMTRLDIADYLGLTVETVSRMLYGLQNTSAIVVERRKVILRNLTALEKFAL